MGLQNKLFQSNYQGYFSRAKKKSCSINDIVSNPLSKVLKVFQASGAEKVRDGMNSHVASSFQRLN